MKTESKIEVYEINGKEDDVQPRTVITIMDHWNRRQFVVVKFNGNTYTVLADELKRAIENAQNAHSF